MSNLEKLQNAAKVAVAEATQRIKKLNTLQFENLVTDLEKEGVAEKAILELKSVIDNVTERNQLLIKYVSEGGAVASRIIEILKKIF